MRFGLMFFAASEEALGQQKYHVVIECARFGDRHGFSSVWVPERHFTRLGSLYPNPAVLHAALARETQQIGLRAGSVVLPLHNPLRVAEEWAVVDNLSDGRVGISFASGWNPNDFAFFPDRYARRGDELFVGIQVVQKLWRGETIAATSGSGAPIDLRIYPTPVQPELPVWVTAAGNPQTFARAGAIGAHLLTHVLDQSIETLAANIAVYRQARAAHGHAPDAGQVTVMVHTFVGADAGVVHEQARRPYCEYLKANIGLLRGLAQSRGQSFDITTMAPEDIDSFAAMLYERFATSRGLIGTPETCLDVVRQLSAAGADEAACLLDFGPSVEQILNNLPHLLRLKERWAAETAAQSRRHDAGTPMAAAAQRSAAAPEALADVQARCADEISASAFYADLLRYGVEMETSFRGIQRLWRHEREALGLVELPDALVASADRYTFHPALLDACLQVFIAALPLEAIAAQGALFLPAGLRGLRIYGPVGARVWSHAVLRSELAGAGFTGDVRIFDAAGSPVVEVEGLRLQRVEARGPDIQEQLDSWLYDIRWRARPLPDAPPAADAAPGLWLVFADQRGVAARLVRQLHSRGETCLVVLPDALAAADDANALAIDAADPQALRRLLEAACVPGQPPCRGIVHLWGLDSLAAEAATVESLERDQVRGVASVMQLVQALHALDFRAPRLWLVTRGAQCTAPSDPGPALAQATIWGFGRTLPLEYPWLRGGMIDLDPAAPADEADRLLAAIWSPDHEDQIALRSGERLVARLEHVAAPAVDRRLAIRSDATYLVTGGLGNLGLHYARWLAEQGARQLVLLGRSGAPEAAREALERLERIGVRLLVARADVADRSAMAGVFEALAADWPPLRGIVHAAGVAGYQTIDAMDAGGLLAMLRPKVAGTWNLFQLARGAELDFFLCISSLSPVWGTKGLAHYAAANHFLDMFGQYGRGLGVPATTINLGPVGEGGMAAATGAIRSAMTHGGLRLLPPQPAVEITMALAAAGVAQQIVVDVDWATFRQLHELGGARPLLESVGGADAADAAGAIAPTAFFQQLEQASRGDREELLLEHIRGEVARVLKLDPARRPDPQQGFFDMGMDSLMALDIKARLQRSLGCRLPTTLAFEHPTPAALTAHLLGWLFPAPPDETISAPQQPVADDLAEAAALSESEIKALIDAELEALIDD